MREYGFGRDYRGRYRKTCKMPTLEEQIASTEEAIRVFEERMADAIARGCDDGRDCAQTGLTICRRNMEILQARRNAQ